MTNSRASATLRLLDNHLATGTEATYTYTPVPALNMKARYREIYIIVTGSATATLEMQLKINAQTDYNVSYNINDTTTATTGLTDAAPTIILLSGGILDGANLFNIQAYIVFNDASDMLMVHAVGSAPHEGNYQVHGQPQTAATTITSIEIKTSTSTWATGTEISIYGIQR